MTTANEAIARVRASAKAGSFKTRVLNKESQFPMGKCIWQGDVGLRRHPLSTEFKVGKPIENRQLIPGSTTGSRHIVRAGTATVLDRQGATALQGPIVLAPEGLYLEHPTHGHFDIQLPGVYETLFQQDLTVEALQRRQD